MDALKAELEMKKAALKSARLKPHTSYVARKEIEQERIRSYFSAQEERSYAKNKRAVSPERAVSIKPSSLEKKLTPSSPSFCIKNPDMYVNASDDDQRFSKLLAMHKNVLSLNLKRGRDDDQDMTANEFLFLFFKSVFLILTFRKLLLEWEKTELQPSSFNNGPSDGIRDKDHPPNGQIGPGSKVEETMEHPFELSSSSSTDQKIISELQPIVRSKQFLSEIFAQTNHYLMPFFVLLQEKKISESVIDHLMEIVTFLQMREYVKANDAYIRLSIGNAPWPIGVTMVCIHERSARERIHSNQVAHVLNDERQRKWIQSIKRLISFCQRAYPPTRITQALG